MGVLRPVAGIELVAGGPGLELIAGGLGESAEDLASPYSEYFAEHPGGGVAVPGRKDWTCL